MTNPAPSPFDFVRTFNPVMTRRRHDGWTADRQVAFIEALAEAGCVANACRRIGMSTESAYALRRRYDAVDFRLAWDAALDYAVQRLSDAALSRAIHGVAVPHYYKGEVVGEHRRFDEGLTRFILRYRDPVTYARRWDRKDVVGGHPEQLAERLAVGVYNVLHDSARDVLERDSAAKADAARAEAAVRNAESRRPFMDAERAAFIRGDADTVVAQRINKAAAAAARRAAVAISDEEAAADAALDAEAAADADAALAALLAEPAARAAASAAEAGAAGAEAAATEAESADPATPADGPAVASPPAFRSDVASGSSTSAGDDPGTDAPTDPPMPPRWPAIVEPAMPEVRTRYGGGNSAAPSKR